MLKFTVTLSDDNNDNSLLMGSKKFANPFAFIWSKPEKLFIGQGKCWVSKQQVLSTETKALRDTKFRSN